MIFHIMEYKLINQDIKEKEVIDWECKGNLIKLYLGKNGEQRGDGWYISNYILNAGKVYKEFISAEAVIYIPWDCTILESNRMLVSKNDIRDRVLPCLTIIQSNNDTTEIYFGDKIF